MNAVNSEKNRLILAKKYMEFSVVSAKIFGEDANDTGDDFVLIPLKNLDEKISHSFELGYITKRKMRLDNISLTYIDAIRRILHIAGFTC